MTAFALSRRGALAFGGATIFVALTGGMLRAADAAGRPLPDGDAYAPWRLWNDPSIARHAAGARRGGRSRRQPARHPALAVRASAPTPSSIFADLSRNLGAMDAYVREMHLGLGCAIENMLLAAGPNGYAAELEATPGSLTALKRTAGAGSRGDPAPEAARGGGAGPALSPPSPIATPTATPTIAPGALPDEWRRFAAELDGGDERSRVSLRGRREAPSVRRRGRRGHRGDHRRQGHDRRQRPLVPQHSSAEIDAHRDGPTLDAAGLSFSHAGRSRGCFRSPPRPATRPGSSQTRDVQLASAPLVGLIAVRDRYDRAGAIAAGRAWQRLHLSATALGLAMQPLNQPIEMIDRERQAGRGATWAARMARLTGAGLAGDLLVPRRLRLAIGAGESPPAPEGRAELTGRRTGACRRDLGRARPAVSS